MDLLVSDGRDNDEETKINTLQTPEIHNFLINACTYMGTLFEYMVDINNCDDRK